MRTEGAPRPPLGLKTIVDVPRPGPQGRPGPVSSNTVADGRGGVINAELVTSKYRRAVGRRWAKARLRDRLDAIIALVIDDGSTDGSAEYLRSVDDPRVLILSQNNQGPGAARNTGLRSVTTSPSTISRNFGLVRGIARPVARASAPEVMPVGDPVPFDASASSAPAGRHLENFRWTFLGLA